MSTAVETKEQDAACEIETCSIPGHDTQGGPRRPSGAATEKPVCRTVEEFVGHVIYDGRFLGTFTIEPEGVAEVLGIEVTPNVVEDVRDRDRGQVLAEVTEKMTRDYSERKITDPHLPNIHVDFGISATVVVAAVVVAAICLISTGQTEVVKDESPDADSKL